MWYSLGVIILFTIIALSFLVISRNNAELAKEYRYGRSFIIFLMGVVIALVQPFNLERVDAGNTAFTVKLTGSDRGVSDYQYQTGWVTYSSWTDILVQTPIYQQHVEYPNQLVITKGGFVTTIKPTFNYAVKAESAGDMYVKLRLPIKEVEQGYLKTAIVGSVNDVANRWTIDSIFNYRESFEGAIVLECNKRLSKWFDISQLRTNIVPPDELKDAIRKKTEAVQLGQAEFEKNKTAILANARKITEARGDSAEVVIRASGEAEAIRRKQITLDANYIEYLRAQKWDGKMPTTVVGNSGNTGTLLNIK